MQTTALRRRYGRAAGRWDKHFSGAPTWGRYRMLAFHQLSPEMQNEARQSYPHKSVGAMYDFADEHYYYPVTKAGKLAQGRGASRFLAIPHERIMDSAYMASLGYTMNPGWPR